MISNLRMRSLQEVMNRSGAKLNLFYRADMSVQRTDYVCVYVCCHASGIIVLDFWKF